MNIPVTFCLLFLATFTFVKGTSINVAPVFDRTDAFLTVPELITKYGYPVEVHNVTTADGYILELHRIPYGKAPNAGPKPNKPVVFLQHGLLTSSAVWVITGPNRGLAYLLADLGYDVWMGNSRGNLYSKKHVSLSPNDKLFWDFSMHELGFYDLPSMIDYVLQISAQEKIFYIGHSTGTSIYYILNSDRPEYNNKIRAMISFAPIAYMGHTTSVILKYISNVPFLFNELTSSTEICKNFTSISQQICENFFFLISGFNENDVNSDLLFIIKGHFPAETSVKLILHLMQWTKSGKFRQYDYGSIKNLQKYKQITPPKYILQNVSSPVALYYAKNDVLVNEVDVKKLYNELGNPIGLFLVSDEKFEHLDFLWGENVIEVLYNPVFDLMDKY